MKCKWQSRQYSVAPELSHQPLKLSCWCCMVLVTTFFLVSLLYRVLQVQSNWYTAGKLLGSNFDSFLRMKFFKLRPKLKLVFMPIFFNPFLNFGPSFCTHGSFTILLFLIVSIFSFSFTEVMLFLYSLKNFCKTFLILCLFSAEKFIKRCIYNLFLELNIFLNKCAVRVIKTL